MGKVYTRFQTETAQKPYGTYLYDLFKRVTPPPPPPGLAGKRGSANLWDCGISVYFDAANMWATEQHYLFNQSDGRYVQHGVYNGKRN